MTDDVLTADDGMVRRYLIDGVASPFDQGQAAAIIDNLVAEVARQKEELRCAHLQEKRLMAERDEQAAEVSRLSRPRTGHCPQCEAMARERDEARAAGFLECLALWNDTPLHMMRAKVAELEARYPRVALAQEVRRGE